MDKLNSNASSDCEANLVEIVERGDLIRTLTDVAREWLESGENERADITLRAIWTMADGTIQYAERALAIVNNRSGAT